MPNRWNIATPSDFQNHNVKLNKIVYTRGVFGTGRLEKLASVKLPCSKALICVTADGLMKKLEIQPRVLDLLKKNSVDVVAFDKVMSNPTKLGGMEVATLTRQGGCDFVIGLGGGSSVDTAKAVSIMM